MNMMMMMIKSVEKIYVSLESDIYNGTLHEDIFTCMVIFSWIMLTMRNVSDNICVENKKTDVSVNYHVSESRDVCEIM